MSQDGHHLLPPLFETKVAKGRAAYWVYASSMFLGICFIFAYRLTHLPLQHNHLKLCSWIGMFMTELWFTFYWILTQSLRCNLIYRYTFKDRLSQRFDKCLPGVDIFVCTADPVIEPPLMVVNTVLSVMAYDYPPEKLHVYLSDDGCSDLMFYALQEASKFSKHWLPFCRKFKVEWRSPAAYFSGRHNGGVKPDDKDMDKEWVFIKRLYEEMEKKIDGAWKLGRVPEEARSQHKGFREWDFVSTTSDHHTILQILIYGKDTEAVDVEGQRLPSLVYLAREKRPQYHHHFKAGAMNALIRVSSKISNSPFILNVDCDMSSSNADSVRDGLCFFMDEKSGHEIAYIQYPQGFMNINKNDIYGNSLRSLAVELHGLDANRGPMYIGSGCFHRRDVLCGKKYFKGEEALHWEQDGNRQITDTVEFLEEKCKIVASCSYEENTPWGEEIGLRYGFPTEDIITGYLIHCRGWRSVGFVPERMAFSGLAPTTLLQTLIQHKRWTEGHLQIFLSKYCPFVYGRGKIPFKHQLSYSRYMLWSANCLATLWFSFVPSFCLVRGVSLFPEITSPWGVPFAYVAMAKYAYSLAEFLYFGGTYKGWINEERMWLYKRLTSYPFAFCETILKKLGRTTSSFVITAKVADEDVEKRYEKEMMEFGVASPMFTILATVALFNLVCLGAAMMGSVMDLKVGATTGKLVLQMVLCGVLVLINLPLYQGLFLRNDRGRVPSTVLYHALVFSSLAFLLALY